jgi:hypothetical protein
MINFKTSSFYEALLSRFPEKKKSIKEILNKFQKSYETVANDLI